MSRNVAKQVRAAYELRPYPALTKALIRRPHWRLPPPEWIRAVAQPPQSWPRRILVAGCGTGLEAFALRRRFPKAEIVGVDFAARSIAIARRLARGANGARDISFLRGDLTSDRLPKVTGGDFDFISCHGVISYLPAPERVIRNLRRSLAPEGVLYLGVNGSEHFSESWRRFLPEFGFEMDRWPGGERIWRHLRLAEPLADGTAGKVLQHGAVYLASDLFGPLIRNLPLEDWARMCARAGLHLRGNAADRRLLWPAINEGSCELLRPRSRADVARLLDILQPSGFHRLIFTRQPEVVPPWEKSRALLSWRPLRTDYFRRFKWPARRGARLFKLENRNANVAIEMRGAGWEIDLLRASDGERSIREILAPLGRTVAPSALRSQLYLFYLLDLLNFLPPVAR